MTEPAVHGLFPTPMLQTKIFRPFTEAEMAVVNKFKDDVTQNTGNTTSKNRYVLDEPGMEELKQNIQFYVNYFMDKVVCPYTNVEAYITQSWLNMTKPGEYHHKHAHPNSYLSGVLYISAEENNDKITFYREGYERIDLSTENYNPFNSKSWWFGIKTGDLVIFPSSLTHMVEQTVSSDVRISLAFNTFLKGYLGGESSLTALHLSEQNMLAPERKEEIRDGGGGY